MPFFYIYFLIQNWNHHPINWKCSTEFQSYANDGCKKEASGANIIIMSINMAAERHKELTMIS